jgi:hypothetical protein
VRNSLTNFSFPVAMWVLAGCSSFRTESGKALPSHPPTFVKGETRVETVIRELGPPNQMSALGDGLAFLYEHSITAEFQLGFSLNLPLIQYLKFVRAWNHLDQQALLITFDDQGVLLGVGSDSWKEDLGGGTAAQLIFAATSLTDLSALRRPADAHSWGRWLLQRPPVVLNAAQSLRLGANGLQQRISPAYVGQQSLETPRPKRVKTKKRPKRE